MPNWHVGVEGAVVRLLHSPADEEGGVWSGLVRIHRGAPDFSHPELHHAFLSLINPAVHADWIRHRWTCEIPARWLDYPNTGVTRRYMVLRATGGGENWTLVLVFPLHTPRFVFQAVAGAFRATPYVPPDTATESRSRKEKSVRSTNDATAKPASLPKGDVPDAKDTPPAFKDGVKSVVAPAT